MEPVDREGSVCSVCGDVAPKHLQYGAICCYSCRAFFRRGVAKEFPCSNDNKCFINKFTRTNCKKCRYARCLQVGMSDEVVVERLEKRRLKVESSAE